MVGFIITTAFTFFRFFLPVEELPLHQQIAGSLANHSFNYPQEKVYLHTDKPFYSPGEDLWFKAYLMIGPYQVPDTLSGVLYVELINDEQFIIDRKILRMRRGLGWGDMQLPASLNSGTYILRAYTRYMQNFDPYFYFRKAIQIIGPAISDVKRNLRVKEDINSRPILLRFFPEGGHLIEGLQNHVAFKATDPSGNGLDVKGRIIDDTGKKITDFESKKFGLGLFVLNPESARRYHAEIEYGGSIYRCELPEAKKEGYVLHVNKSGEKVYIQVLNNFLEQMNGSFVIGQFRGFPFVTVHAKKNENNIYTVLDTRKIPSGIIHFTFFDSLGIPHCERLVYNENENDRIEFDLESDKKTYGKREEAVFNIHCEDLEGNTVLTNLSLAITNTEIVRPDRSKSNLRSYFTLESDLKGQIEQPGYYFNPENKDRFMLLDMLMLTHGWRRFVWKEILDEPPLDLIHQPEVGFNITGGLVDYHNPSRARAGHVRLFIYEGQFYYNEVETDENGFFGFLGMDIYDSTHVVMQAWREPANAKKSKKNKPPERKNDLTIKVKEQPQAVINPDLWPQWQLPDNGLTDFQDLNALILKIDSSFEGRTIIMDELLIEERKLVEQDPFYHSTKLHKNPSRRIVLDSLSETEQSLYLFDLIRRYFPGVRIYGAPPDVRITLRGPTSFTGSGQPLLLLDGQRVESDFLYYFPASEIQFIDLLQANRAGIYGADAGAGVIAVFTRTTPFPYEKEGRKGMHNFVHPGYYRAREFYSPVYSVPDESHAKPDYRRVLHWEPSLTTDDMGDIQFSFFTSDEEAEYRVEVEGMTYTGIPVTYDYFFSVE
jgi:hypothetical protein